MKTKLIIAFILFAPSLFAQKENLIDSLSSEICKTIIESSENNDSIRVLNAFIKHFKEIPDRYSTEEKRTIGETVYFRLQRNCPFFKKLLERNAPENKYWHPLEKKPESKVTISDCNSFKEIKKYKYIESTGDTTELEIGNGFWVDHFKDGSYSRLKLIWDENQCYFDIEFLESNNYIRNKFSKKGDKYRYTIIEKKENYYVLCMEALGINRYYIFNVYLD